MKIRYSTFVLLAFIFLALPAVVFFLGFLKILWAVFFTAATLAAGFFLVRDSARSSKVITAGPALLIGTAVFCLLWSYLAGIGEFTWTTADHTVRAAVLNDLVEYDWPVYFDLSHQSNPAVRAVLGDGEVAFAYYFTFWLVPALAGKVFGITAGRVALVIWGGAGLYLIVMGLFFTQKKASFSAVVIMFLFSGLDIIPDIYQEFFTDYGVAWEGWNDQLYIHGNFYQTMNVFHQCIGGWLATMLLITAEDRKNVGTCGALIFCYSPWAAIGALPVAGYELLRKREDGFRTKSIISAGNIVLPVCFLACFGTFYTANIGATGDKGFIWNFFPGLGPLLLAYVLYVIIEFGIWALVVYKDQKSNGLYWVCLITLIVFPIYKMTEANDLLMRGTMVPMFVFTVFLLAKTDSVLEKIKQTKKISDIYGIGFFALLFLMTFIPIMLIITVVTGTIDIFTGVETSVRVKDRIVSFGDIQDEEFTEVTRRQFYVYESEQTTFFRIFGKERK